MKKFTRYLLLVLIVCLLAGMTACASAFVAPTATPTPTVTLIPTATVTPTPAPIQPVNEERKLKVGDVERNYFLHIPAGLNDQQAVPLVFIFHGYQENYTIARNYSDMDHISDLNGFIAVYPSGTGVANGLSWNASGCCGEALKTNVDEPAFVRSMIADVETLARIDPKRIYAAGESNGGLLSYRLACTMSDTFAAIAPVSAVLMYAPCEPKQPVSVIHVHGSKDLFVPLEGGGLGIQFPPVKESLATWVKLDGCSGEEKTEKKGFLTLTTYGTCAPGIDVQFYVVESGGHNWPSKYAVPISQTIWDFFAAHPKP